MIRYVFGTKNEALAFRSVQNLAPRGEICVLGDKFDISDEDDIVHIGYCEGDGVIDGALIEPLCAVDTKSKETIRVNSLFPLEHRVCFSGRDFPFFDSPAIHDRVLFKIGELPHKNLYSIKIVRDEKQVKEGSWIRAASLLLDYLRE